MSTIRKQPFIEKTLNKLSAEELGALKTLLNTNSTANVNAEFGNLPDTAITPVYFHFPDGYYKTGILLKNQQVLVLLCYTTKYQEIELFELDNSNYKANKIYEDCTIEELRRALDDQQEHGGDEWVETMKEVLIYDAEAEEIQAGTDVEVDGDLTVNSKLELGTSGTVGDNFRDAIGVPDATGHLGQTLVHGTTGNAWEKLTTMGISSGTATNGQVLTADGNGGVSWASGGGGGSDVAIFDAQSPQGWEYVEDEGVYEVNISGFEAFASANTNKIIAIKNMTYYDADEEEVYSINNALIMNEIYGDGHYGTTLTYAGVVIKIFAFRNTFYCYIEE